MHHIQIAGIWAVLDWQSVAIIVKAKYAERVRSAYLVKAKKRCNFHYLLWNYTIFVCLKVAIEFLKVQYGL